MEIRFSRDFGPGSLDSLKNDWRQSLVAPQDGMWESFLEGATHWSIECDGQLAGYSCINSENQLLQFFLRSEFLQQGSRPLWEFLKELKVSQAIVGTNNPVCLSMALQLQSGVRVHSFLFENVLHSSVTRQENVVRATPNDVNKLVEFCHIATGGPSEWLVGYLTNLINREELFFLSVSKEIVGTCEVRKSDTNRTVADIGMVVSPDHRREGWGTYLLGVAKRTAIEWGRQPICSCEKDNIGSLKSIHANGFRSVHQMLLIDF